MEEISEIEKINTRSVSVKEAAKVMGKSEQFVRIGLQTKRLPFGLAVQVSTRWTYYISPAKFYDFVGTKIKS